MRGQERGGNGAGPHCQHSVQAVRVRAKAGRDGDKRGLLEEAARSGGRYAQEKGVGVACEVKSVKFITYYLLVHVFD